MPVRRPSKRQTFTKHDVASLLGIRSHHVQNLVDRGYLAPSVSRGRRGRGGHRIFNVCDLVAIRSAQELTRLGVVGQRLGRACRRIRQIERSGVPRTLFVITHTGDVLHVPHGRRLLQLLRQAERPFGHVVLDLERVSRDVERTIREHKTKG